MTQIFHPKRPGMAARTPRRGKPVTPFVREKMRRQPSADADDMSDFETKLMQLEIQVAQEVSDISKQRREFEQSREVIRQQAADVERKSRLAQTVRHLKQKLEQVREQTAELYALQKLNDLDRARTISVPLAREIESSEDAELFLQKKVAQLRKRVRDADQRLLRAREVLAEPIDDLRAEELLSEVSKQNMRDVEERVKQTSPDRSEDDLPRLQMEVEDIEANNLERSQHLSRLQ
jgi:hypothetical protein